MSDPKRATLITVGAPKSAKKNVTNTVRLAINLQESTESKYTELNYKELVIAEEKKKVVVNGKPDGLDPFSDNDEDVERVARKFEQKYGGKSTYGRKGRTKKDEYADIGLGYDENDSFIDNTDGYDEMIPPECDTVHGGFYINSGSLEFKPVPENQSLHSDSDVPNQRRNKRAISSSSSDDDSSESSSSSRSQKETPVVNGIVHNKEHRKKKVKKTDKKAKRVKRNDSSAATSGKQTSDDAPASAESADSRTSQSDSLASKPAPSSENAVTSDSSRDAPDSKLESTLPSPLKRVIDEIKNCIARLQLTNPHVAITEIQKETEPFLVRLEAATSACDSAASSVAWSIIARMLNCDKSSLISKVKAIRSKEGTSQAPVQQQQATNPTITITKPQQTATKRKANAKIDYEKLTAHERETKINNALERLNTLIKEREPSMLANYKAECERVQEEKKKIQIASSSGEAPHIEKRMPKRRFPWCQRTRNVLTELTKLAGSPAEGASLLANRALPLFTKGFVRIPTLLRQADLRTEDLTKRPRSNSNTCQQPTTVTAPVTATVNPQFPEPIHFPSSLTVTTTVKTSPDKTETVVVNKESHYPAYSKKDDKELEVKDYLPPNSIGSITITPVNSKIDKPVSNVSKPVNHASYEKQKEPLIRVKSPAALLKEANELAKKDKDKIKVKEKKRVNSPLHIDTSFQPKEKVTPSPNNKKDEITNKAIEKLKISEDNIPRPVLIPVHHSPTFAKPEKRPPDIKKKKDLVIVSDVDPLSDLNEPVAIDDSSSDVELVEDKNEISVNKNEPTISKNETTFNKNEPTISQNETILNKNELIAKKNEPSGTKNEKCVLKSDPSFNKNELSVNKKDVNINRCDSVKSVIVPSKDSVQEKEKARGDEEDVDIDAVMKNIRDLRDSQVPSFTSNSYDSVLSSAKHAKHAGEAAGRTDKDKLTNFFKQYGWM